MNSFLETAVWMDPQQPTRSLRTLLGVHRWRSGAPSFRRVIDRHTAGNEPVPVLWLNSELLPAVQVDNPLPRTPGGVLGENADVVANLPRRITLGPVVARKARARELGREIVGATAAQRGYAVAGLCEVYDTSAEDLILDSIDRHGPARSVAAARGPKPAVGATSGLFTVACDLEVTRVRQRPFDAVGLDRGVFVDQLASKGVLLTEVDLGAGRIEVFTTHLFSGVRLLDRQLGPAEAVLEIQLEQIDQVVDFIREHHRPAHVAILMGDLNIAASDDNFVDDRHPYRELTRRLRALGMYDIWTHHIADTNGPPVGYTWHDGSVDRNQLCDRTVSCWCDEQSPLRVPRAKRRHAFVRRIDYVFIEEPRPSHGLDLDVTRPRRRPFRRPRATEGKVHISDHLGLEFEMIGSG